MKDNAASVLARLKNQSKEMKISYQMCLQLFFQEEFLRRLSMSPYADNFILKGGLFIYTLTDFQSRATQDIDFLMRCLSNDLRNVKEIMEEVSRISTDHDYISIEVLSAENITPDKEYPGVTVKFVGHIRQVRAPFSIDIGVDDVIVPEAVKRSLKTRFADFEEPQIYTYSLESTIAEKFDAILKRMEGTSRMKDFFDIYYLSNLFDFDGRKLQEAIWQTIQHRGTSYEADSFERISKFRNNYFLTSQWLRYQPSIQMELPEFHDVLDRLQQFLGPIYDAVIHEKEFFMNWTATTGNWQEQSTEAILFSNPPDTWQVKPQSPA